MNAYLANGLYCCSFGGGNSDEISIEPRIVLVDEDGVVAETYSHFVEGKTYTAKKMWFIKKSYRDMVHFDTEAEAQKEYERILAELSINNTVVRL